jgi:hypothetical protein
VARVADTRVEDRVLLRNADGKTPGVNGRIILKWTYEKWNWGPWTGSICLMTGTGGGLL